jgi:hypothetical protein
MNSLQRFYQWISDTPPLFKLNAPFVTMENIPTRALVENEEYDGNPRLGFLYQYLCSKLLENSPRYELIAEEIQLNNQSGQTIGAVDLILKNRETNALEHWEVAIKFYLLHEGLWYGPNAHDKLHKKLDRMLNHQLKMSQRKEFHQQLSLTQIPSEHLLIQGRLYVNPFSQEPIPSECLGFELNPNQISGYWCYQRQWEQIGEPLYALPKPLWAIGSNECLKPIDKPTGRFIHAQTKSGQFWFIVEDTWPVQN